MRLRQLALVARNLDQVRADIAAVLGIDYAYLDPAVARYGLRNVVFPVGDTFLEVVSPQTAGTTAGRLLDKRGGDGGYMVIVQVPDVGLARDRVRACGVRIVEQLDRDGAAMTHLHPKDMGGAILSLDFMDPEQRWDWGGPDWQQHVNTDSSLLITGAELQVDDPAQVARQWSRVLGVAAQEKDACYRIALNNSEIRFVACAVGTTAGLSALDLVVRDRQAVHSIAVQRRLIDAEGEIAVAGTRFRLLQAA